MIEPVWVWKVEREIKREVVVVLDDSGSMQLKDDGAEAKRRWRRLRSWKNSAKSCGCGW